MMYIVTWTYIFKVTKFQNVNISKTVRTAEKCSIMTFIDVDIRDRTAKFRICTL